MVSYRRRDHKIGQFLASGAYSGVFHGVGGGGWREWVQADLVVDCHPLSGRKKFSKFNSNISEILLIV